MKTKRTRKHLLALAILVILAFGIIGTAAAATLKSSLYFSNVQNYSLKTSTFDANYTVNIQGKATKNAGSNASLWYMKFDGRTHSGHYPTDGNTKYWSTSVKKTTNTYGAYNTYTTAGFISGSVLCYQH